MLPKQVQSLIEKYCMGVQPTDKQLDEIFAAVAETNADPAEVAAYMEKLQKGPTKAELEKKAKEEAAKKAKAEAEEKAKAEAEKKAKAEASKKAQEAAAAQKAQAETEKIRALANGHDFVDFGVPGLPVWATCNIGTASLGQRGSEFAWGETQTKSEFKETNYKHLKKGILSDTKLKYNSRDNKTQLELEDDAARAQWGGKWQMPTYAEFKLLIETCNLLQDTVNGVPGIRFSYNGKSIFFPMGGYWTSSVEFRKVGDKVVLFDSFAKGVGVVKDTVATLKDAFRYQGHYIRPVIRK